jgi:hypothetical protein
MNIKCNYKLEKKKKKKKIEKLEIKKKQIIKLFEKRIG